jgi:hypothetical protein
MNNLTKLYCFLEIGTDKRVKEHGEKNTKEIKLYVSDVALLYDETLGRGRSRKLSSQWIGPYEIVAIDKVYATI